MLRRSPWVTPRNPSNALVDGIAALSRGWLSPTHRERLLQFMQHPDRFYREREPLVTAQAVRALLLEADRVERLERSLKGPGLTVHVNRPILDVTCTAIGPFLAPLSRLRLALLPDEADHVELYDVRVGEEQDRPIGISVISRLPRYEPNTVREVPVHVNINGTPISRYLPGATLAGQLRDGADPSDPVLLSPEDLLGGVKIDLGRTFPPMSYVYLFYRVDPGHVFCAVVEPLDEETAP